MAFGFFGSGDYKDLKPAGTTVDCPVCHAPCSDWTKALEHCQHSWNSQTCSHCGGSGRVYAKRCPTCHGTGRVSY